MADEVEHLVGQPLDNQGGDEPPVDPPVDPPVVGDGEARDGAHAVLPEDQGGGQGLADPPVETEGGNNAAGGTKQKTTSRKTRMVEKEPPPFMLNRLVSNKEFSHLTNSRNESSSNMNKVLAFFHYQVDISSSSQPSSSDFCNQDFVQDKGSD